METTTKTVPLSKSELAIAYGVSVKTLNAWLRPFNKEIGTYRGRMYTPKQMKTIYQYLGNP